MPHELIAVLVPAGTEDVGKKVDELLTPYSPWYVVAPWQYRFDEGQVKRIVEMVSKDPQRFRSNRDATDIKGILQDFHNYMERETGDRVTVVGDETGYYYWTTDNPGCKFDSFYMYEVLGSLKDLPADFERSTVVTPDGVWHEGENWSEILAQKKECIVASVDIDN